MQRILNPPGLQFLKDQQRLIKGLVSNSSSSLNNISFISSATTSYLNERKKFQRALQPTFTLFLKEQKRIQEIIEPSIYSFFREQKRINNLLNKGLTNVHTGIMDFKRALGPSMSAVIDEQTRIAKTFENAVPSFAKAIKNDSNWLASRITNYTSSLQAVSNWVNTNSKYLRYQEEFFLEKSLEEFEAAIENEDQESILAAFSRLIELLKSHFVSLKSKISMAEFLQILDITVIIIIFSITYHLTQESIKSQEKYQIEIIERLDTLIALQTEVLDQSKEKTEEINYVVLRDVTLRISPKINKGNKIALLLPNHKVQLIKDKKKWIYVEYFDYIEGLPKMGWVYKKYLKRIYNNP